MDRRLGNFGEGIIANQLKNRLLSSPETCLKPHDFGLDTRPFLSRLAINVKYRAEPTDGFFGDIIRGQAIKAEKDAENYIYYSFWWIVRKDDRVAMGSCGFKNIPDENGEVEIGYGLAKKEYEGRGFMAEAIKALCRWALAQKDVKRIIAETDKGNLKSENVLKRVGFAAYKHKHDDNGATWWRL